MFEMMDYGMPLPAITASPTGSVMSEQYDSGEQYNQQTAYDSIFDTRMKTTMADSIFDTQMKTTMTDSIFENTGQRNSYQSSDDVFEFIDRRKTEFSDFREDGKQLRSTLEPIAWTVQTLCSTFGEALALVR